MKKRSHFQLYQLFLTHFHVRVGGLRSWLLIDDQDQCSSSMLIINAHHQCSTSMCSKSEFLNHAYAYIYRFSKSEQLLHQFPRSYLQDQSCSRSFLRDQSCSYRGFRSVVFNSNRKMVLRVCCFINVHRPVECGLINT